MPTSSLVSTAAAAAAFIPFHCVICFEEFDVTLRFPVVLPCGHTYVCVQCAKRLTKCMECRETLFLSGTSKALHVSGRGGGPPLYPQGRYQAPSSPVTPKTPVSSHHQETIPLPLPKNIVLISMMEAAQRQASEQVSSKRHDDESSHESTSEAMQNSSTDDNDDDEFDSNHIISGLVTFSGPCGTYAVCDPDGLTVLSKLPESSPQNGEDNEVDQASGLQGTELEQNKPAKGQTCRETSPQDEEDDEVDQANGLRGTDVEQFKIAKGQTCQIVTFSDGVAKLARGRGYIIANSSQLVKVGAPLDKCCQLEGMIETVALRGRDLQTALNENQQLEQELRERVEVECSRTPAHPVISEVPKPEEAVRKLYDVPSKEYMLLVPNSPRDVYVTEATDSSGLELVGENTMRLYAEPTSRIPSSPNTIDNSEFHRFDANHPPGIPRYRRNSDDDFNEFAYGCGSALFGKAFLNFDTHGEHRVGLSFDSLDGAEQQDPQFEILADSTPRSNNNGTAASPARPPNQNYVSNIMSAATPILSSSFDAVDWRTGMSGHRGLSKSSPRSIPNRTVRMMSEHRGLGATRPASGRHSSPSSSPASVPRLIAGVEYEDYMQTDHLGP